MKIEKINFLTSYEVWFGLRQFASGAQRLVVASCLESALQANYDEDILSACAYRGTHTSSLTLARTFS